MERVLYTVKSNGHNTIFITLIVAFLAATLMPSVAICSDGQQDRQKLVEQLVARWMQIGLEQYERRYYKAAEQSFLMAKDYEEYLGSEQKDKLNALLEKAHAAAAEVDRISGDIARAQQLLAAGRLAEARVLFEQVQGNEYLTAETQQIVERGLAATSDEAAVRQAEMAQLYNQSVDYYNAGELEKARAGFLEISKSGLMVAPVGSRAEDYLAKIDAALAERVMQQPDYTQPDVAEMEKELFGAADQTAMEAGLAAVEEPVTAQPGYDVGVSAVATEPVTEVPQVPERGGYIEVIRRRQNILRSHTEAVVNDALAKARSYQAENQFDQAEKSVEYARNIVNKNRLYLGEEQFERYSDELQRMQDEVTSAQSAHGAQTAQAARIAAEQTQKKIRDQMEQDRKNRIKELKDNTLAYQKQQRYKEALGQLQSLIAIDPLDQQALIMKDTLEDTIAFEEQLKVIKEQQREKANLLLEASRSEIPYPKEMTISKDWLEISARRVPKEAIGQDPATARVYEQLEQVVDLSELSPDMPFGEALEILRRSVDPPLKIVPLWRDLYDNADIDQSTAINMDPISSVKLGSALKFLLEAVSGGFAELGYGIENGIITIATKESIPAELITLVYDVTDLVGVPAEYRTEVSGGAGGGAAGGVSDVGGGFQDTGQEDVLGRDELREERLTRINDLILLIQDTVFPDSWFDAGGEGTVTSYGNRLLSVRQTADVHNQIASLLEELRKAHGYQIAIEARFLKVRENFLEDIGLDVDILYNPGGKWSELSFTQGSAAFAAAASTGIEGSFPAIDTLASTLTGGYGTILDDLQVSFVLNATQAHGDSTLITAPKATVLSGEQATFRVQRSLFYARDIEVESRESGEAARGLVTVNYDDASVTSGTIMNISPTIAPDKKHVLLDIDVQLNDFLGFREQIIDVPVFGDIPGAGDTYTIPFPEVETAQVRTRVNVPDGGTLLLGGQKLGAEVDKEVGVPVLSKIPILGRAFSNRSKVKDHKILLILVKPTIILQEEVEADAVAELKNSF